MSIEIAPDEAQASFLYNDVHQLQNIKSNRDQQQALHQVSKQFEAVFLQTILKHMRQANSAMRDPDSPLSSRQQDFYQSFYDGQLASEISKKSNIGIADMLIKQLSAAVPKSNEKPVTGALSESARAAESFAVTMHTKPVQSKSVQPSWLQATVLDRLFGGATDVAVAPVDDAPSNSQKNNFINNLFPYAIRAARALGTSPSVLLAQAALETGWGRGILRSGKQSSYNLFNIKASPGWQGEQVTVFAPEVIDGQSVNQESPFRVYRSFAESFEDYVTFLRSNRRYAKALQHAGNPERYFNHLQKAGYATDPQYARKLQGVWQQVQQMLE
ncbi:MAG: flagellar assembly peptidoglycan hydrolase FlgJ [Plesiomonas sp.]|uniref:flagellar assembly peptidoglycan hydrolase FlgJ n=1 Tax=Plesiomonas sp. TaxID=2486279 RepID=UPI003F3CC6B3